MGISLPVLDRSQLRQRSEVDPDEHQDIEQEEDNIAGTDERSRRVMISDQTQDEDDHKGS